jgi:hypothetical protein
MKEIGNKDREKYFLLEFIVEYTTSQRKGSLLTGADNDESFWCSSEPALKISTS